MRALAAEFGKLTRPLTAWLLGALVLFALFQLFVHEINGQQQAAGLAAVRDSIVPVPAEETDPPPCEVLKLPPGPECAQAQAEFLAARKEGMRVAEEARKQHVRHVEQAVLVRTPLGAALLAVGMWASIPGALVVGLLAGGHIAGEWSARTLKVALAQDGRRTRFLAVKALSVWLTSAALMLVTVVVLAAGAPLVALAMPLDAGGITARTTPVEVLTEFGRALVVLAVFTAIGVFASVLTRTPLGSILLSTGALVAALVSANLLGPVSPGNWVSAWMDPSRPLMLWVSQPVPGPLIGLTGLIALIATALTAAALRFRRMDVTG